MKMKDESNKKNQEFLKENDTGQESTIRGN
jgi:hypothetical protein